MLLSRINSRFLALFVMYIGRVSAMAIAGTTSIQNCAVVGVGVLGTYLCQQVLHDPSFKDCQLTGLTKTTTHHADILAKLQNNERFQLTTVDENQKKFQNVVFCAPPSGSDDYPATVKHAVENLWQGPEGGGVFVYTSSGAVYGPGDNTNTVTEDSPLADSNDSPRIARLLQAERECLSKGGTVLRLAGLYTLERGAHNFWLSKGQVQNSPEGLINLLHYSDAASACLACIKAGLETCQSRVFLISDSHPMTRKDICTSALQAKHYQNYQMPQFTNNNNEQASTPSSLGKIYNGQASNKALNWQPEYKSFDEFMKSHA